MNEKLNAIKEDVYKRQQQGITVLRSSQPVFDTAYAVQKLLEE